MKISFGGINTGLPPNLVEQIVQAERIPIQNLENRSRKSQAKLDLVGTLENGIRDVQKSLSDLSGTGGFRSTNLISSDPSVISGNVNPGLVSPNASIDIEVIQLAEKASAITNGFPDKDRTEVGVGYLSFETGEGDKEVYIDGSNNTLQGVMEAINGAGLGLRATVIKDRADEESPFRLVISGEGVGGDSKIIYPTVYFLDGDQDLFFEEEREAKNGLVKIDGFELEVADNRIEDVIPGVTVDLKQASPGKKINLTVQEDVEVVSGKIDSFINAMNGVLGFIQQQSKIDAGTDTSQTLGGDSLLRSVANRFRRVLQGDQLGVSGNIKRLNQIGIEYTREGTLKFDNEKFNKILAADPESAESFFVGNGFTTGFVASMANNTKVLLESGFGIISNRKRGLQQRIDQTNKQIDRKEQQLVKKEDTLRRKFARLEETMSRLNSQRSQLGAVGGGFNLGGGTVSG